MTRGRIFTLFLLMNIVNYLDRYITSGVLPLLKEHFHATDLMLGSLGTAFMITYSFTALPFGIWSDRWKPHKVAAIGVGIWSVATFLSSFAWSLSSLFLFRSFVGLGEAAYAATASAILSGQFPKDRRSIVLGLFNLGIPVGGAAGVLLGGVIGAQVGWQAAFALVGFPGLILAVLTWRLRIESSAVDADAAAPAGWRWNLQGIGSLFRNPAYMLACLGYSGISFAFGSIVLFAPSLFVRDFGYSLGQAGLVTGAIQVLAGLIGAPLGGWIGDAWQKRNPRGRAYILTLVMTLSAVFLFFGVAMHNITFFFFSTLFMLMHVGVASAFILDVTEKPLWNTSQSIALLIMHLLGDIPGSAIIGYISDRTSLSFSISLLPIPMVLAALFFLAAGLRSHVRFVSQGSISSS
ncbi:MFS transporter [Paenibacillus filicis]|uniref:MFS transporter n=1 Tax=Paenibacillus gyeongsangnamensis TaxID=3388067 RepID=A0ABT4Q8C6_9BACL|nr:MFS transporter [Paenibacillus filicis]MCZ8513131.1 MFS transporter [Paenibacillus filicis]